MLRASPQCQCGEYCWIRTQAKVGESRVAGRGEGNNAAAEGLDELGAPSALQDAILEDSVCCAETDKDGGSERGGFLFTGLIVPVFGFARHDQEPFVQRAKFVILASGSGRQEIEEGGYLNHWSSSSEEDGYLRVRFVGLNYIRKFGISNESASRNDI